MAILHAKTSNKIIITLHSSPRPLDRKKTKEAFVRGLSQYEVKIFSNTNWWEDWTLYMFVYQLLLIQHFPPGICEYFTSGWDLPCMNVFCLFIQQSQWTRNWTVLLSPNINMYILLSVPHMFLMVLVERICTNIKTFHVWWSFPLFSWPVCLIK